VRGQRLVKEQEVPMRSFDSWHCPSAALGAGRTAEAAVPTCSLLDSKFCEILGAMLYGPIPDGEAFDGMQS
jgi:hypothetical protein